jgi:hypothetical protein
VAAQIDWLAHRATVPVDEVHLQAGDPRRALAVLTPEPSTDGCRMPR